MSFFKRLFSRGGHTAKPPLSAIAGATKEIENMSLMEIIDFMRQVGNTVPAGNLNAISRRLYQIALYDHHVAVQDREVALKLVDAVDRDLEAPLANNPAGLAAFRHATDYMKENAKFIGYGSLTWLLEENRVPPDQVIAFIMRKEHAHLLGNAMHAMGKDAVMKVMPALIRKLILNHRSSTIRNDVLVLHGLACAQDLAFEVLFTESERTALRLAHRDYAAARNVLVALGLLPATSGIQLVGSLSDSQLGQLVFRMLRDEWDDRDAERELATYLNSVGAEWGQGFVIARLLLSAHLALAHVGMIYGNATSSRLHADLLHAFPQIRDLGFLLEKVSVAEKVTAADSAISLDLLIFDAITGKGEPEQTEAQFEATRAQWMRGGELLTRRRIQFLYRLRFMLNCLAAKTAGFDGDRQFTDTMESALAAPPTEFEEDCIV